jgi:carbon storage regulator CsrA
MAHLILTRYKHERIRIGEDIVVSVEQTGRDKASLGIKAPKNLDIRTVELDPSMMPTEPTVEHSWRRR